MQEYHNTQENTTQEYQSVPFLSICAIADSYEHSLTIDRILYEMTGDLESAAIMSRLRYWFSPSKINGQTRAKSRHDGKLWLARKDDEWEEEACVRVKQMPRVKKHLKKLGLVNIAIYKWDGNPTTHWHLNVQKFTEMYNETIQKMISKYPNGEKGDTPMGKKENPQRGKSINKHIPHASSSSSIEHICAEGENAFSGELDELGNAVFHETYNLKGKGKENYDSLTEDQKRAVRLLRNVPPTSSQDSRFELITAFNVARNKGLDGVRKAIMVYKQRLERGDTPNVMGAYLLKIINEGHEPLPEHADQNKRAWLDKKSKFPHGSYDERWDGVIFHFYPNRELNYRMSHEVFVTQLRNAFQDLKERE